MKTKTIEMEPESLMYYSKDHGLVFNLFDLIDTVDDLIMIDQDHLQKERYMPTLVEVHEWIDELVVNGSRSEEDFLYEEVGTDLLDLLDYKYTEPVNVRKWFGWDDALFETNCTHCNRLIKEDEPRYRATVDFDGGALDGEIFGEIGIYCTDCCTTDDCCTEEEEETYDNYHHDALNDAVFYVEDGATE